MQRFLDILLSLLALAILLPLFIVTIIILKFTGEGEVFYKQQRVGLGGHSFGVFKFATMVKNSSAMGTGFITTKNDPRVLPFGKFLRKTKINEFPQLINILIGEMSFVGPRPQVEKHFNMYAEKVRSEIAKFQPGLTGIGSIIFRDEESILDRNNDMSYDQCYSELIAPYKGDLELWYSKNRSTFLYLSIIFITGWVVAFPKSKLPFLVFKTLPKPPDQLSLL